MTSPAMDTKPPAEFAGNCSEIDRTPGRPNDGPLSPAERQGYRQLQIALNRRAAVEDVLISVANGKRELLTRDECRDLAAKLGTPPEFGTQ